MTPLQINTVEAYREALDDEGALELFDYWNTLRAGRSTPMRREIDVLGMPRKIIPWLYILSVSADGDHLFRLAGTGLEQIFNADVSGKRISDVLQGRDLDNARRSYDFVTSNSRPWYSSVLYRVDDSRDARYARMTLPLGPDGAAPDFLLGGLFLDLDDGLYERFAELHARDGIDPLSRREVVLV